MNKRKLFFGIFFMCIGVIFFIITNISVTKTIKFSKNAIKIDGEISDIRTSTSTNSKGKRTTKHSVYVTYEYEKQTYKAQLSVYTSSMHEGDKLVLLIDPENPKVVVNTGTMWLIPSILIIGGSIFIFTGIINIILFVKKVFRYKRIMQEGEKIVTKVIDIGVNKKIKINGVYPKYLICKYKDGSKLYTFKSETSIKINNTFIDKTVTVYFLSEDEYFVDIKSISE